MELADLFAVLERVAPMTEKGTTAYCPTGAPYLKFVNGDVVEPGAIVPLCTTAGEAIERFLDGFQKYRSRNPDKRIYWRDVPQLIKHPTKEQWICRARLVAS